ncbi:hypothetical protein D9M71_500870 [compost metagenome]
MIGMACGWPPNSAISRLCTGLAVRSLRPAKSAMLRIGCLRVCSSTLSVRWVASSCMPWYSFWPWACRKSHIAWLLASAERFMNGSSNAPVSGKRPLV